MNNRVKLWWVKWKNVFQLKGQDLEVKYMYINERLHIWSMCVFMSFYFFNFNFIICSLLLYILITWFILIITRVYMYTNQLNVWLGFNNAVQKCNKIQIIKKKKSNEKSMIHVQNVQMNSLSSAPNSRLNSMMHLKQ